VLHDFNIHEIDKNTHQTNLEGVFAAGSIIKKEKMAIRCVAQGKEVAASIDSFFKR
jgi:NADPH-dependent glutamate synthase beta subunit-like oxidoreductase